MPARSRLRRCVRQIQRSQVKRQGYGNFRCNRKMQMSHRIAYELLVKPPKNCVLHRCNNPRCCNPAHLYEGSKYQNRVDAILARTAYMPEGLKLTPADVHVIRTLRSEGHTQTKIAKMFGVTHGCISRLVNKKAWTYV